MTSDHWGLLGIGFFIGALCTTILWGGLSFFMYVCKNWLEEYDMRIVSDDSEVKDLKDEHEKSKSE